MFSQFIVSWSRLKLVLWAHKPHVMHVYNFPITFNPQLDSSRYVEFQNSEISGLIHLIVYFTSLNFVL